MPAVPAPASRRPSPPTNAAELTRLEEEVEAERRALEAAVGELRKETQSALEGVRESAEAGADELAEELEELSCTALQAIRDIDGNLANIDQTLVDVDDNLNGIGNSLELVYQRVIDFEDRLDGMQGQIAEDTRTAMNLMSSQLALARDSNQRMSDLQGALDTYAWITLLASGANAILLVLLLVLVLKAEQNTRYAIDLVKVMLAEFNIPIPDPPVGALGRLRSWCNHRRHWRWLPPTVGLTGRALAAAVVVMVALAIVGLEYGESQPAGPWLPIGLGAAALLVARQRRGRSDRLGAPVLALIPAVVGEAGGLRRILVRDNGLRFADGGFVLGRHAPLVDVVVANPSVSRRHARIFREGSGRYYVEDLNSSNGTQVNGMQLEPFKRQAIEIEDRVRLGGVDLSVEPVR